MSLAHCRATPVLGSKTIGARRFTVVTSPSGSWRRLTISRKVARSSDSPACAARSCKSSPAIATSTSVHENDNSNHHNPKRHRVRFNPKNASYRHTLAISDMSIEEKDSYWITPIEFAESKNQSAMILRMMMKCHSQNQQQLQETDEICCRGLGKFLIFSSS